MSKTIRHQRKTFPQWGIPLASVPRTWLVSKPITPKTFPACIQSYLSGLKRDNTNFPKDVLL